MAHTSPKAALPRLSYAAMSLALCLLLPFLTGQIPQVGSALCPMHLPVLLCGFLCGPWWAAAVGLVAPLLRHAVFSMPPILTAIAMSFELGTYGLSAGLFWRLGRKTLPALYFSLIAAMISGRLVWGAVQLLLLGLSGQQFTLALFWTGAVANAVPGILSQLILIPLLMLTLQRANLLGEPIRSMNG